MFSSLFAGRIAEVFAPLGLSHHTSVVAQISMQAALRVVSAEPTSVDTASYLDVTQAFMEGFHRGCVVGAVVATTVGLSTFYFLPHPAASPGHTTRAEPVHSQ